MWTLSARLVCLCILLPLVACERYTVPPARIEVNHPKGFSVSVPDSQGIQLFAFHGNLNSPMEGLEAGQFSADILKHKGGRWTFTDKKHEIKVGDTLYYWLYVQKDSMGYRRDDQKHVFSEHEVFGSKTNGGANNNNNNNENVGNNDTFGGFDEAAQTTTPSSINEQPSTHRTIHRTTTNRQPMPDYVRPHTRQPQPGGRPAFDNCNSSTPPLMVGLPTVTDIHHHHHHYLPNITNCMPCMAGSNPSNSNSGSDSGTSMRDSDLNGVNTKITDLYSEIEHLKQKINHLNDIVTDLMKQTTDIGTKLILTGVHVDQNTNLFELVRRIILDKLLLKDLRNDIYSATRTKDGVVFDVANALDKRRILSKAKENLGNETFKILDYYVKDGVEVKNDADVPKIDVRFGDDDAEADTNDDTNEEDEDEN